LFDLYLSLPVNSMFRPYLGGGIGRGGIIASYHNPYFAWKAAAGTTIWFNSKRWFLSTGVSCDNVRKDLGVAIGIELKLNKTVQGILNQNGSTFEHPFDKYILQDNNTPDSFYTDKFDHSEVVNRHKKTSTKSHYTSANYEFQTSGGEKVTTTLKDSSGNTVGTATSETSKKESSLKPAMLKRQHIIMCLMLQSHGTGTSGLTIIKTCLISETNRTPASWQDG